MLQSCKKDKLIEDPGAQLEFSQDTVWYDTVFTSIGSTTKYFRVKNPYNQKIKISSLKLARGASSFFRMNVDGSPGYEFNDIEIAAKDSLYIFVEVTINPANQNNPFVYQDSILFETNGNLQDVDLIAWGQDAYYHRPKNCVYFLSGGSFCYDTLNCNDVWNNDKPHVVFGYAVVDSACTLTINAGTRVYFHQNAGLWVYRYGTLKVLGTSSQPVRFQGDRLEPEYAEIPGQWDRIWINEGSTGNIIDNAIIKNSYIGIQASFAPFDGLNLPWATGAENKKLILSNTKIYNCSGAALLCRYFNVVASNLILANAAEYLALLQFGGSYSFRHCTIANFWSGSARSTPSVYINNYTSAQTVPLDSIFLSNCIVDGSESNELQFDTASTANSVNNFIFENSLIKTNATLHPSHSFNNLINVAPQFVNPNGVDFKLNASSPARNMGNITTANKIPLDYEGYSRFLDSGPDAGAFEYH